jgi:rare lipoprotein A
MIRQYSASGFCAIVALLAWPASFAHARKPDAPVVNDAAVVNAAWPGESGTASWYGLKHNGHRTASGARFNQKALTAAHPWLPFGTRVRVTLGTSGRSIIVVITDRLYSQRRILDLSRAAAQELGMIGRGIATVSLAPG